MSSAVSKPIPSQAKKAKSNTKENIQRDEDSLGRILAELQNSESKEQLFRDRSGTVELLSEVEDLESELPDLAEPLKTPRAFKPVPLPKSHTTADFDTIFVRSSQSVKKRAISKNDETAPKKPRHEIQQPGHSEQQHDVAFSDGIAMEIDPPGAQDPLFQPEHTSDLEADGLYSQSEEPPTQINLGAPDFEDEEMNDTARYFFEWLKKVKIVEDQE